MSDNKRQFVRFPFANAVGLQRGEWPAEGSLSDNISLGGIKLNISAFIPLNTILSLNVQLPLQQHTASVKGKVVWVKEIPFGERFEIGVEFLSESLGQTHEDLIRSYIHSRRG